MLLIRANKAGEFAEFSFPQNTFEIFPADGEESQKLWGEISGMFDFVEEKRILFFRWETRLILKIDAQDYLITSRTTSRVDIPLINRLLRQIPDFLLPPSVVGKMAVRNEFHLLEDENPAFQFKYAPPYDSLTHFPFDFTPFIDLTEDDFMVFISGVVNSIERKEKMWCRRCRNIC
jgi:hypothetical protein